MNLPKGKPHETDQSREKKKREEMREIQRQEKGKEGGRGRSETDACQNQPFRSQSENWVENFDSTFPLPPFFFSGNQVRSDHHVRNDRIRFSVRSLSKRRKMISFILIQRT